MILVNTYVANLAAALSTESVVMAFQKAEDLAYQKKIKYGAKSNGSTMSFFQVSNMICKNKEEIEIVDEY